MSVEDLRLANRRVLEIYTGGQSAVIIRDRQELLSNDVSELNDSREIAIQGFWKTLAEEPLMAGAAISWYRYGMYNIHYFATEKRRETIDRILTAAEKSDEYLRPIAGERGISGGFMYTDGSMPEFFAKLYVKEFYSPPEFEKGSEFEIGNELSITGKSREMDLLALVMFRD